MPSPATLMLVHDAHSAPGVENRFLVLNPPDKDEPLAWGGTDVLITFQCTDVLAV